MFGKLEEQQAEGSRNDETGPVNLNPLITDRIPGDTGRSDKEFFIRSTFETDVKKGYDLLFRHYYASLCSHAVRYVYSKEVAEDIVAEVFLVFWKKSVHKDINTSFRAYLFTSVRNKCLTYLKWEFSKDVSEDLTDFDTVSAYPQPDRIMEFDELYHRIEQTISALPPQCQKVFLMSRFEGKSYQEIADKLQVSRKAVEAHISKGLLELRKVLQNYAILFLAAFSDLI